MAITNNTQNIHTNQFLKKKSIGKELIEDTENQIAISVGGSQPGDIIRIINIDVSRGIRARFATNRKAITSYLFNKANNWNVEKAQQWVKEHR